MAYPLIVDTPSLRDAPQATSTQVQKTWRRVLSMVRSSGRVVVTNHGDVEAVVVSRQELERLDHEIGELRERVRKLTGGAPSVDQLHEQFLERLGSRDEAAFSDRLRTAGRTRVALEGRLKAGDRF
jgi:PHD/YefM family antitoxin component YafN of YafNO toxin-antitoxin module